MIPIFSGLESADHRATLLSVRDLFEEPPRTVCSISFKSLRARRQTSRYVAKTIESGLPVVLTSGYEHADPSDSLVKLRDEYYQMLADVPEVMYAVQFRPSPEEGMPTDERVLPLADGSDLDVVLRVLEHNNSIAMAYRDGDDPRIPALLRVALESGGLVLGTSMVDLSKARRTGMNAVLLSSWLDPGRYGEVQMWDGVTFHRSKDKHGMLHRFGPLIERAGFDMDLVRRHDSREMNRLAAWSMLSWAVHLTSSPEPVEDISDAPEESNEPAAQKPSGASVIPFPKSANTPTAKHPAGTRKERPRQTLPVFSLREQTVLGEDENGNPTLTTGSHLRTPGESLRVCDTCFLASVCPAYQPQHSCAFNFPVEVRTPTQIKALLASMVELQAGRVAFAKYAEELNGGYPDPVVGREMDRLMAMSERMMRASEHRERLTVSVEAEASQAVGAGGVLSRLFGGRPSAPPSEPIMIQADVSDQDGPDPLD